MTTSSYKELDVKPVEFIQWGILSGEEWKNYAVLEVCKPCPKSMSDDMTGTVYDSRMGEQRDLVPCTTCGKTRMVCPGHFGVITLPFPVYNKEFTPIIIKLLQCVCSRCSRPRLSPFHMEMLGFMRQQGFTRLKAIAEKCNKSFKVCPWDDCGEPLIYYSLPVKKRGEHGTIYYTVEALSPKGEGKTIKREEFSSADAYGVLSKISFEDLRTLGFNEDLLNNPQYVKPEFLTSESQIHVHQFRAESMIYTHIPVLPPAARPFIQADDSIKNDDLTDGYNDLVKAIILYNSFNVNIDKKNTVSTRRGKVKTKSDVERDIIDLVYALTNNKDEKNKAPNNNKARRSVVYRLIGKDGRIQQNVGGKRTNYSARTVIIGGGIRLRDDQFGVPRDIAEIESKPIFVGPWNIKECQELVSNGKVNYVTRKRIIPGFGPTSNKTVLTKLPDNGKDFILRNGDIIGRHLQDGDVVFVNRQPTLRPESMIAFRVKVVEGMAFQLPLWATKSFNADFDGGHPKLTEFWFIANLI